MTSHAHRSGAPDHVTDYLPAYLNGTLAEAGPDTPTPASIAVHLQECPACRRELAAWTAIAAAIPPISATATPASPTTGTLAALMAAIDAPAWQRTWPERSTPVQPRSEGKTADPIALHQPMPVERRHWTRASALGLIAAVLILVATVAITSAPDSESDPPRLPAIAAASPAATATMDPGSPSASVQIVPEAIDIAECTTEPRPPGTVAGLLAAQESTPYPDAHRYDEVGTEPSVETLAGIDATLRQIVACRYAYFEGITGPDEGSIDLDGRTLALYTDGWVTGMATEMAGEDGDGFNVIRAPIIPLDSSVLSRQNAIQLRDGSVRVSLRPLSGYDENPEYQPESLEILFILEDGRWLVDDWWEEPLGRNREGDTTSVPLSAPAPQAVQVVVADAVVVVYPTSDDEARLSASQETIVSVANLRDVPLDFSLPTLGFSVTIDPGHSVDLLLTDLVGIHPIDAVPAGGSDLIDSSLILWPDQSSPTPEPQADAPDTDNASPYVRVRSQDEAIDSAECTTAPRTPGTVAQLRAAHGGTPESVVPTPNPHLSHEDFFDPTLDGSDPAPETFAGIESTLRQLVACRFYGLFTPWVASYDLDSRHLALFSDRYVVGLAMEMEGDSFRLPFMPYDSGPLTIIDAAERPEGVLVRLGAVPGYGEQTVHLLMVQEHGKWVIDDWRNFIVCANPNSAPQRAPRATGVEMPQVLPIVATDGFATIWQTPELDPLQTGTDVIITVANLGEESSRFEIPGLGFATDIAAGHSLDLVVNAPAGTYPLILDRPGIPDMLDADLTLEPNPGGTPIPECSP